MLPYANNLDDYGFYEVGNSRFYSKITAIIESARWRLPVRWNYLDAEFDCYDWTKEPTPSLPELYAQRARQLREQYDYLILHFSGGSDSAQIMETFINNNIHLDEVLIRGSISQAAKLPAGVVSAENNYSECLVQSLPLAEWVKQHHMPHLRITVTDTTEIIVDYFRQNPDWVEHCVGLLTPHLHTKGTLELLAPHYADLTERGLKVAHIYGADKPRLYRKNNIFYTKWADNSIMAFNSFRTSRKENPQYIELFYWGKNTVPLQIKQLHIMKNYVKANNLPDSAFDGQQAIAHGHDQTMVGRAIDNWTAALIYQRTLPLLMEHLKPLNTSIVRDMDAWFAKDPHDQAWKNYHAGIEYLATQIPRHWQCEQGIWHKTGIKIMHSRPRFLGT